MDGGRRARDVWRHQRWRRLAIGYGWTHTAEYLVAVVVVVVLAERTGSTGWVAAATVSQLVALVLLGPAGGAWAQRSDRRRLLVGLGLARAAGTAVLAVVIGAGGAPLVLAALGVAVAALGAPVRPATFASTPDLVPEADLAAAVAAQSLVSELCYFLGPAVGAGTVAVAGAGWATAVGAAFHLAGAVAWSGIGPSSGAAVGAAVGGVPTASRAGPVTGTAAGPTTVEPAGPTAAVDPLAPIAAPVGPAVLAGRPPPAVVQAVRLVRQSPGMASLIAAMSAAMLMVGFEQVVHVFLSEDRLGLGTAGVGVISASLGAGALGVLPFIGWVERCRDPGFVVVGALGTMATTTTILSTLRTPALACAVLVVEGAAGMVFQITTFTLLQRGCPGDGLALVVGLHDSATAGAQLVGSLVAPLLVAGVHVGGAMAVIGAVVAISAVLTAPGASRLARSTRAERERLAPLVEHLRGLGLFGDAPTVALERIARAARTEVAAAGTVIFSEGDAPADLYVVLAGELDVRTAALGTINHMGPNDWFGELGLVHGIPRTATVAATTAVELLAVPGQVFLSAVIGGLADGPDRVARAWLGRTHPHLVR